MRCVYGSKIQALMLNIEYPEEETVMSISDMETQQATNTDRAKSFAKSNKNSSNCSTGRQKCIKLLSSRCSSSTLLQLPSVKLRYKNYVSKMKPIFAVSELSLCVMEKTFLQYGLQRLSKLSDIAANYLCFIFC